VGAFVEDLDRERVALGKSFGLDLLPVREWCRLTCGGEGDSLCEVCRGNPAYEKIKRQKEFRTRYLLEDIPYGLVPMIELGRMQGLAMERMDLMARLGQHLLRDDSFIARGRTLQNLGVARMSPDQFARFIETGER
jgi:opine dehydrogenase